MDLEDIILPSIEKHSKPPSTTSSFRDNNIKNVEEDNEIQVIRSFTYINSRYHYILPLLLLLFCTTTIINTIIYIFVYLIYIISY